MKEISSRRISIILKEALSNKKNAKKTWYIKSVKQLQHWVNTQSENVITVLNELRNERNETLLCLKEWNDMMNKTQKAIDQTRRTQNR